MAKIINPGMFLGSINPDIIDTIYYGERTFAQTQSGTQYFACGGKPEYFVLWDKNIKWSEYAETDGIWGMLLSIGRIQTFSISYIANQSVFCTEGTTKYERSQNRYNGRFFYSNKFIGRQLEESKFLAGHTYCWLSIVLKEGT